MARNVALIFLTITLGFFFVFTGTVKISPVISAEAFKTMKTEFKSYAKVFPLNGVGGWKLKPSILRKTVGTLEVLCGLVLIVIPGRLKLLANGLLLGLMLGAVYTHWALGNELQHVCGAIIFSLLLTCRLAIHLQQSDGDSKALAAENDGNSVNSAEAATVAAGEQQSKKEL